MPSKRPPSYVYQPSDSGRDEEADNKNTGDDGDSFNDEDAESEDGDSMKKWTFSPLTIFLLVILNLMAIGGTAYLTWHFVDAKPKPPVPALVPFTPPTLAPARSMRPSNGPSVSIKPSDATASAPPSLSPTVSDAPTAAAAADASSSPTISGYLCNLCGDGMSMSTANLDASVNFGPRVTRTCQELLTDQQNGYITEEQCIALFPSVSTTCGCVSSETG